MDELSRELGITLPKGSSAGLCIRSNIPKGMCHEVLIDGCRAFIEHTWSTVADHTYLVAAIDFDIAFANALRCRASTWQLAVVDFRLRLASLRSQSIAGLEPVAAQEPISPNRQEPTVSPLTATKEPIMTTEISKPSNPVVPSPYDSAKSAVRSGLYLGFVRMLVNASKPPAVRLVTKAFGAGAGKKAAAWLDKEKGHAMFSVAVGGLGLGAQALGWTGNAEWTAKINRLCQSAVSDGIAMGASTVAKELFGDLFEAFRAVSAQIDDLDDAPTCGRSKGSGEQEEPV